MKIKFYEVGKMLEVSNGSYIEFDYTNWKGVFGHRKGRVQRIYYGSTEFHLETQWLIEMLDMDKAETRVFAMKDMINVEYWLTVDKDLK
jgi:poly-D-alanine transfer protein DltD